LWTGDQYYVRALWDGVVFGLCGNADGFCTFSQFTDLISGIIQDMTLSQFLEICNSPLEVPPLIDNYYQSFAWIFGIFNAIFIVYITYKVNQFRKLKEKAENTSSRISVMFGELD
jgi:hypothetical protein